jgi:hypothetical protein
MRGRGGRCGARESEGATAGALESVFIERGGEESHCRAAMAINGHGRASALIAIKEEGALRRKTVRIDGGE